MSNEEFESFEPDLISLLDEEGNEYEFEILDEIDFKVLTSMHLCHYSIFRNRI